MNATKAHFWSLAVTVAAVMMVTVPAIAQDASQPVSIDQLEEAMTLSELERAALTDVTDDQTKFRETAFFLLVKHAAELPKLRRDQWNALDAPSYRNMLRNPERYRATPVRLKLRVYSVKRLVGDEFARTRHWPVDKPIWRMYCTTTDPENYASQPLVIYSVTDPEKLSAPAEISPDGEMLYPQGPEIDLLAVFYKVFRDRQREGERMRSYPLLIGWDYRIVRSSEEISALKQVAILAALAGIFLLGTAFFYLRRKIKAQKKAAKKKYESFREKENDEPEETTEEGEVDPLLREASERYRKERNPRDGTDRQG